MIKIFRKIRQQSLTENKFSKYLIYAIGEIILVAIGILIALQVNNWNNSRIERKTEIKLLKEISSNLATDLRNIKLKIKENDIFINSNSNILEHLKDKTEITKSLERDYASLLGHGIFQPITTSYENLKSQGIYKIRNDSLRYVISKLYDSKYYFISDNVYYLHSEIRNIKTKIFLDKLTTTRPYFSSRPINLVELQNDIKFHEVLIWNIFVLEYVRGLFETGITEMKEVQNKIKDELEQM